MSTAEKIAELQQQPFWQRAFVAQAGNPHWDPSQSLLHNIGANIGQARRRGQNLIADRRQALDMQSALQPGFALRRMQHFFRHGDPVVTDPADRLLLDTENVGL